MTTRRGRSPTFSRLLSTQSPSHASDPATLPLQFAPRTPKVAPPAPLSPLFAIPRSYSCSHSPLLIILPIPDLLPVAIIRLLFPTLPLLARPSTHPLRFSPLTSVSLINSRRLLVLLFLPQNPRHAELISGVCVPAVPRAPPDHVSLRLLLPNTHDLRHLETVGRQSPFLRPDDL